MGLRSLRLTPLQPSLVFTPRQVRRWKDQGQLETQDRRITEKWLGQFLRAHHDRIPFDSLRREDQVYLVDLGFPCPEATTFKRMSAISWTVLVGKGSHAARFEAVTPPQWTPVTARRTRMVMTAQLLLLGLLAETNPRGASHSTSCLTTLRSTRQQPVAIPQRKAVDPDTRQARHRDSATRRSASRDTLGDG